MYHMYRGRRDCGSRGIVAMWGSGENGGGRSFGHAQGLGGGNRRGGGRRGRLFDSGALRLLLLTLIDESPRHGYDLIREIGERTGGAYAPSPGMIYPTLTLLDDMGLITATAEGSRKQFAITEAGKAELVEKAAEVAALMARLAEIGAARAKSDGGPVGRAMGNLRAVLSNRLGAQDVEPDTLHEIAALLDDVAQKIERL